MSDAAERSGGRGRWRRGAVYALLVIGSLVYVFPFFWMVSTSLKTPSNIMLDPPQWIPDPVAWENYARILEIGPVFWWLSNSVVVATATVVGRTVTSLIIAYGFARFAFPGSRALFVVLLSTLMLPDHVTIIPRFIMFRDWGWLDTLLPLVVPNLFGGAFAIFLIRQFLMTLPRELDEAAEVDGASSWQVLWHILVPLSKPAVATVAVLTFISAWNEFFEPFIFLSSPEKLTLAVGLRWVRTRYETQFELMMALSVIAVVPILIAFFFAQKQFIRGIALTGIKG